MKSKAIVWVLAIVAMVGGATACNVGNIDCGNQGVSALDEAGGGGSGGGDGGATTGGPCFGCFARTGACVEGSAPDACGSLGGSCSACSFGETCSKGMCSAGTSICIGMLADAGFGADCSKDAECANDEWCAVSCCDPVTHVCFAVGKCVPKRDAGEHCDHVGGDHECSSGVCDPVTDTCQ